MVEGVPKFCLCRAYLCVRDDSLQANGKHGRCGSQTAGDFKTWRSLSMAQWLVNQC